MHAGLPFHQLASIFPLMRGAEYEALVGDIRENGLLEPIVLYDGQVLDGRNRQRACLDAGVPLRTITYDGDDPLSFVLSQNLERRQLNESQRAMAAARLAILSDGVRSDRQGAQNCAPTQEQAADRMRVARRSVQSARIVQQRSEPEIIDAVDDGEMRVSSAASLAGRSREEQLARLERDRRKANGTHRHEDDWYRTPGQCTRALLRVERFESEIWECACGDGAISRELEAYGHTVISSDLIGRGYGNSGVDFLAARELWASDIITNPPYDKADEFALHALSLGVRKMALLCRLAWLEGQDRYERLYSQRKLARVWTFSPRQTLWRGDSGEGDGGMTAYQWFIFERDHNGGYTGDWLTAEMVR